MEVAGEGERGGEEGGSRHLRMHECEARGDLLENVCGFGLGVSPYCHHVVEELPPSHELHHLTRAARGSFKVRVGLR